MSINGFDFDYGRFKNRNSAPIIYGCVENPYDHGGLEAKEVEETHLLVSFGVASGYEWYDKNNPNVLTSIYPKKDLTFCHRKEEFIDS